MISAQKKCKKAQVEGGLMGRIKAEGQGFNAKARIPFGLCVKSLKSVNSVVKNSAMLALPSSPDLAGEVLFQH
jgi:hypothetical protein